MTRATVKKQFPISCKNSLARTATSLPCLLWGFVIYAGAAVLLWPPGASADGTALGISQSGTNISVHWPQSMSNYVLETAATLASDWEVTTNKPVLSTTNLVAAVASSDTARFYRLREKYDFYGKRIGFLKLFGQKRWGEISPGPITSKRVWHAAGVHVDRSAEPNHIYAADTGNNRILGFRSFGTNDPVMVFGQPDEFSGAANGDSNVGMLGPTTASNLCLFAVPIAENTVEQWHHLNFDTDTEGNLYVPDIGNNRILVYYSPFSPDKAGRKGDTIADFVIGQDNFTSNSVNHGLGPNARDASSLFIDFSSPLVASRGVSVDPQGNVWVADTFNSRVLRFAHGSATANLVVGQPDFTTSVPATAADNNPYNLPTNRLGYPSLARVNPETGDLFVIDEFQPGFAARILVFSPPFSNGMSAASLMLPKQPLLGDYASGYSFSLATGLIFNTFKTDDSLAPDSPAKRYRDGIFWVHAYQNRTLLLDMEGNILLTIGAPNSTTYGGRWEDYCTVPTEPPYSLWRPGGMMGIDSSNNLYLASTDKNLVSRYSLPYQKSASGTNVCLPLAEDYLFGSPVLWLGVTNHDAGPAHIYYNGLGAYAHKEQLFVHDLQRYMVWNDYLHKNSGADADVFVGQTDGWNIAHTPENDLINGATRHAVDDQDRLWLFGWDAHLLLFQLPFQTNSGLLRGGIPLYWSDSPDQEVDYEAYSAIAFDKRTRSLWVFDLSHYRLLRVNNPDDWSTKLLVDCVIGQTNKTDGQINRGMVKPDAASLTGVSDIRFDNEGNLFVVDNTYECHPNGRLMAFLVSDLAAITNMFPSITAKKLYVTQTFDQTDICDRSADIPCSPVSVAFNSRNEMVIGNDGEYRDERLRTWRQLYLYRYPLIKSTPDAWIEVPMGEPDEIMFDSQDNLIVQDGTYNRVWVLNYDVDPAWLLPIPGFSGAPRILSQPTDLAVAPGSNAVFSVEADGPLPLSFQWYFSRTSIAAATGASLSLTNVQATNAGDYTVVVANQFGSVTSSVAHLIVATNGCAAGIGSLVSWWRAEGNAVDQRGVNNGTLVGAVGTSTGLVGSGFSFSGSNGYVQLPENLYPFPTVGAPQTPFPFELWFRTSAGGVILGQQACGPFDACGAYVPALYVGTDGRLYSQFFYDGSVNPFASAVPVNDGGYHHVAATYDGTNLVQYLDSLLIGSRVFLQQVYSDTYYYQLGTGRTGGWPAGNGDWYSFRGIIDEVALYSSALSSNQVAAIFQAGPFGKCVISP